MHGCLRLTILAGPVILAAASATAETRGNLTLTIAGKPEVFVVDDRFAGRQTSWELGGGPDGYSIGLVGEHADGTLIELVVETSGGQVTFATVQMSEATQGPLWRGTSHDGLTASIAALATEAAWMTVSGRFSGPVTADGIMARVDGSFSATIPRHDFAPTPGP